MKIELAYRVKLIPELSDDMSVRDVLREIVAYTELTKKMYDRNEPRYRLYSRDAVVDFCENILSLVKQEVY